MEIEKPTTLPPLGISTGTAFCEHFWYHPDVGAGGWPTWFPGFSECPARLWLDTCGGKGSELMALVELRGGINIHRASSAKVLPIWILGSLIGPIFDVQDMGL